MRFAILLPTVREGTGVFFGALMESLTYPTDVFVLRDMLDQREGHSQALNRALEWIDAERHGVVVKMDDDILLRKGWQDVVVQAFWDVPKLGVCGLDVSHVDAEAMTRGMARGGMVPVAGSTRWRELATGNVWGMLMASPVGVMLEVGKIPVVGGEMYPFFADGWYCKEVRKRGYKVGYVVCPQGAEPDVIVYDDPVEYVAGKEADTLRIWDDAQREMRR